MAAACCPAAPCCPWLPAPESSRPHLHALPCPAAAHLPGAQLPGARPAAAAADLPVPGLQGGCGGGRGSPGPALPALLLAVTVSAAPGPRLAPWLPGFRWCSGAVQPLTALSSITPQQIEEHYISAAELGRLTGVPPELILRTELTALQARCWAAGGRGMLCIPCVVTRGWLPPVQRSDALAESRTLTPTPMLALPIPHAGPQV